MKAIFLMFILLFTACTDNLLFACDREKSEILLRLPLLSTKNATIISNALDTMKGIEGIEASFELKVMIIGFDNQIITDDTVVMKILNNLQINTPIEKIYSTDIPIIRNKYKLKNLRPPKEIN